MVSEIGILARKSFLPIVQVHYGRFCSGGCSYCYMSESNWQLYSDGTVSELWFGDENQVTGNTCDRGRVSFSSCTWETEVLFASLQSKTTFPSVPPVKFFGVHTAALEQ
jgi:hypothetical protein